MVHGRGRRAGYRPGERPARARAAQDADGSPRQHYTYRGAEYRTAACPACGQAIHLVRAATGPLRAEDHGPPWDGHGCLDGRDGAAAAEGWAALALQARHRDPLAAGWALLEAARCDPAGAAARQAADAVLDAPAAGDGPLLELLSDAGDPDTAARASLRLGEHLDAAGDLPGAARAYARALGCAAFDPEPAARLTDLVRRAGEHPDPAAALRALRAAATVRDARLRAETALAAAQVYRRAGDHRAAVKAYRDTLTAALPAHALRAAVGLLDPDLRSGDTAEDDLPEDAPRMVLHAGRVLARLGMPAHAAAMYGLLLGAAAPPYTDDAGRALARLAGGDETAATPEAAVQMLADLGAARAGHRPGTDRGPQPDMTAIGRKAGGRDPAGYGG